MRTRFLVEDRRGTAALEFALILPILATMLLGTYEVSNLLMANMKVTAATQTAADLVAQTNKSITLTQCDLMKVANAAAQVMAPLPTDPLKISIASITYAGSPASGKTPATAPAAAWQYQWNGAGTIDPTSSSVAPVLANLGTVSSSSSDSVIMVAVTYNYVSPISYVLGKTYLFTDTAYDRPRYVTSGTSGIPATPSSPSSCS